MLQNSLAWGLSCSLLQEPQAFLPNLWGSNRKAGLFLGLSMALSRTRKRDPGVCILFGVWAYCGRWGPISSSCDERVARKEPGNVLYTEDTEGKNGF